MTLPLSQALGALQLGAEARAVDPRFTERLDAIRELVGDELAWVEQELRRVTAEGLAPATAAATHLMGLGGKRVRPLALLLSAACIGPAPASARELAVVAELIHAATLLHDDVVDEGMERRGAVTARRLWGNGVSVLAGDLLLTHALERCATAAPAQLPSLITTLRRLVDGEILQLRGRAELDVSERTYDAILRGKTASLFAWCSKVGGELAGATALEREALERFGGELGMAFQLVDDALDYDGEDTGKTLLADLGEGKLTLPLVLTVERQPALRRALERVHAGERAPELLAQIARAVRAEGACDEVRRRARQRSRAATEALGALPASPARRLLEAVAEQLTTRVR